jgi:hypothetical protein
MVDEEMFRLYVKRLELEARLKLVYHKLFMKRFEPPKQPPWFKK